jgi:hypothetical protein
MEGAGIAWVSDLHGAAFFSIKVITDIVDGSRPTEHEFLENLHHAADSLQNALPNIIDYLSDKSINTLRQSS